jgi:hypothetical protein
MATILLTVARDRKQPGSARVEAVQAFMDIIRECAATVAPRPKEGQTDA